MSMTAFTFISKSCQIIAGPETAISAQISEITDFGAKIKLQQPFLVPNEFEMIFLKRSLACKVVWRQSDSMGVIFDR